MLKVGLSGGVWVEDGPEFLIVGPKEMQLFAEATDEDESMDLHSGDTLEPGKVYIVWPDGEADSDGEFKLLLDNGPRKLIDGHWVLIEGSTKTIDRRKDVWERIRDDEEED